MYMCLGSNESQASKLRIESQVLRQNNVKAKRFNSNLKCRGFCCSCTHPYHSPLSTSIHPHLPTREQRLCPSSVFIPIICYQRGELSYNGSWKKKYVSNGATVLCDSYRWLQATGWDLWLSLAIPTCGTGAIWWTISGIIVRLVLLLSLLLRGFPSLMWLLIGRRVT